MGNIWFRSVVELPWPKEQPKLRGEDNSKLDLANPTTRLLHESSMNLFSQALSLVPHLVQMNSLGRDEQFRSRSLQDYILTKREYFQEHQAADKSRSKIAPSRAGFIKASALPRTQNSRSDILAADQVDSSKDVIDIIGQSGDLDFLIPSMSKRAATLVRNIHKPNLTDRITSSITSVKTKEIGGSKGKSRK